jgi:hypothetical protein
MIERTENVRLQLDLILDLLKEILGTDKLTKVAEAEVADALAAGTKFTANGVTLTAGSSSDAVADLQTLGDGNFYHITEAAATPGQHLEVDFVSVDDFRQVQIVGSYSGAATHSIAVQLYNYTDTQWDTFNAMQDSQEDVSTADGYILGSYGFYVPNATDYIGTGGDLGDVIVRFYHTMAGNASHDTYLDVVALYK